MNISKGLLAMLMVASLCSCKKESSVKGCTDPTSSNYNSSATVDDGSCQYTGNATFWIDAPSSDIAVAISTSAGALVKSIDGVYYYTLEPSCGASHCANFTLPIGTYAWAAESTYRSWSGTITVNKNACAKMLLAD